MDISFIVDPYTANGTRYNVSYRIDLEGVDSVTSVTLQRMNASLNDSFATLQLKNLEQSTAYIIEKVVTLTTEDNRYSDSSNSATGVTGEDN